jgi:two-component system OmpR family response regulator
VRILLAEDDAMLADAISRALSQSAHTVDVARDGAQADAALATDSFDLAILDVGLPHFDGFEVLRRLRARRSRVPVLILSV